MLVGTHCLKEITSPWEGNMTVLQGAGIGSRRLGEYFHMLITGLGRALQFNTAQTSTYPGTSIAPARTLAHWACYFGRAATIGHFGYIGLSSMPMRMHIDRQPRSFGSAQTSDWHIHLGDRSREGLVSIRLR